MSVLARFRDTASAEFEMNAVKLHKYTHQRLSSVPNRRKKFVCPKIEKLTSSMYCDVIMGNEQSYRAEDGRSMRNALFERAIRTLTQLQDPLIVFTSLQDASEGGMQEWIGMINREIALLNGAIGYQEGERKLPLLEVYDMKYSEDAIFVQKMRAYHRYCYDKIIRVPLEYKEYLSESILRMVDDALCCVIKGNRKIPTNKQEYEYREKMFQRAIRDLNSMQRPIYALWNVMMYSERVLDEWSGQLEEVLKLLRGVIKSDRQRFKQLR